MTAKPREWEGIRTYFDGRVQGQNLTRSSDLKWEVREGYAETSLGSLDIRAGRQIIVWGRADKVNPTDVWSSRDYKLLVTDDEDQRLGASAVQLTWNSGIYHLIGIWQPEWRTPVYPVPPLAPGFSVQSLDPRGATDQLGLKLDHSGEGVDWSISYAHTLDSTPDLSILSSGVNGTLLGLKFQSVDTVGGDFSVPVGEYGLRGEIAHSQTHNEGGNDPLTHKRNLFAVLGIERTFGGEFNVNAQYLYKRVFNFQDPATLSDPLMAGLAEQENVLSNQLAPNMHGASLRFDDKLLNETLEIETAAVLWSPRGGYALRPKVSYAFSDRIKGILGGQIYGGSHDSSFGELKGGSTAFAEVRLGF